MNGRAVEINFGRFTGWPKSLSQVWEWRVVGAGPELSLKPAPPPADMGRDFLLLYQGDWKELQDFSQLCFLCSVDSLGGFGCWLCW